LLYLQPKKRHLQAKFAAHCAVSEEAPTTPRSEDCIGQDEHCMRAFSMVDTTSKHSKFGQTLETTSDQIYLNVRLDSFSETLKLEE
ncbi:hypothetical protein ACJX0J_012299, partial [Zea mays]